MWTARKLSSFCFLPLMSGALSCMAESVSNQWNGAWSGQDPAARAVMIQQANAIALRQSDYYSSFGPANSTFSSTSNSNTSIGTQNATSYSTTSVGSMNTTNSSVNGSNNNLTSNSTTNSSGAMQSTLGY